VGSASGGSASPSSSAGGKTADTTTPSKNGAGTGSSGNVDGCFAAKNDFYSKLGNTGSYTEEKEITDKDGRVRKQFCLRPQKKDLYDVYKELGNLEGSCASEVGAVFYGEDSESACVWVDDPPGGTAKPGFKDHNIADIFTRASAENTGPTVHTPKVGN
jgi:hypothetical protein